MQVIPARASLPLRNLSGSLLLLAACVMFGQITGCGQRAPKRDVSTLLDRLADPARSDSLLRSIPSSLFLEQDLPALYAALERSYTDDSLKNGTRTVLLGVLEHVHDARTVGFVEELLPVLTKYPHIQAAALRVLAAMRSQASIAALAGILTREPGHYSARSLVSLLPMIPDSALKHLFPAFFSLSHERDWQLPVYEALTSALESGALSPALMQDSLPVMIAQHDQLQQEYRKRDVKRDATMLETQACLDLMLRAMAHYPARPEVKRLLVRGMADRDPELRLSAAFVCLNAGIPVSDSVIGSLAADFRVRNVLFLRLQERGLGQRFPTKYHNQQAIAESDLALWLVNPENSGRFPQEIKFLKTLPMEDDPAAEQVYVFRFRYPGDTWRIGISGPQPALDSELLTGGYLTNSLYKSEAQIDLDAHVGELMTE